MPKIMHGGKEYSGGSGGGGGGTSASTISDLADVDLDDLSDGQFLKYDGTSQKWENVTETSNKNIVGTTDPSSSAGNENDVYYKLNSTRFPRDYTKLKLTITADRSSDGYTQLSRVDVIKTDDTLYSWSGTTVSANCTYANSEHPNNLVDGSTLTKFCGALNPGFGTPVILTFTLGTAISSSNIKQWKWYTANDESGRDPVSFTLSASSDGTNWIDLDSASDASITIYRNSLAYTGNIAPIEDPAIKNRYLKIDGSWLEDDVGGAKAIELTWDEYEALSSEEKLDETKVYYISDYGTGSGARTIKVESYVSSVTTSQYGWIAGVKDKFGNNLTKNDQILGIDIMTADATNYPSFLWTLVGVSWYAKAINLNNFQPIQNAITFKVRITYIKNMSSEA